ncbi:MAG: hypothetical protein IPN80_06185 [Flavobacterium sp.]|nr:hypothetical protein [Flavobacterium sp.]
MPFFLMGIAQQEQALQNQVLQLESVSTPTAEMLDLSKFTNVYQTITLNNNRFVLNVQFHAVNNSDGTASSDNYFGETDALKILARLNEEFNKHNIFFKYRGLTTINNSIYVQQINDIPTAKAMKDQFIDENKYDVNSINIFMTKDNYNPFNTYYTTFGEDNTDILMPDATNYPLHHIGLIPASMGRSLGLLYVAFGSSLYSFGMPNFTEPCTLANGSTQLQDPSVTPSQLPNAENVTRNPSSPQYNATTKGDLVADTQACFYASTNNYCSNVTDGVWNMNTFVSHPSVTDQVYAPYVCTINEGNNFMGLLTPRYIGYNGLFTPGQVRRMKEYIEGNMNNIFRQKLNVFEDDSPDISVLYEPFISNMSNGNNTMYEAFRTFTTNSTQTGANVWIMGHLPCDFKQDLIVSLVPQKELLLNQYTNNTIHRLLLMLGLKYLY